MQRSVNIDIAITHIVTRKRQTFVAIIGVAIGVGIYLFMNSLSSGFTAFSRGEIFKNTAHIKIYKNDELSKPFVVDSSSEIPIIINPQITTTSYKLLNPQALLNTVKAEPYITNAIAQVSFDAFYNKGTAQLKGTIQGVHIQEYDAMFGLSKYMKAGSINQLEGNLNAVIIGSGIAEKLNLTINDRLSATSANNVVKQLQIVGIFTTGNSISDQSKAYINISTAQQFVKQGPDYVSTIFANTPNANNAEKYAQQLQAITNYTVEDWKTTNADVLAGDVTRSTLMGSISLSILLVAAFGIYNILSSTIAQKINDIAILKATGFSSNDVIKIFVLESFIMGCLGTIGGLLFGSVLIAIVSNIYMGGPVGYFPISFEMHLYVRTFVLGIFITICAGFFPAKKAASVDPIEIFRK